MEVNAVVCDDEQVYVDQISKCLYDYCYDHSITYKLDKYTDGAELLGSTEVYNIAFLDIEVNGVSGLEIAKSLKDRNKSVIIFFITAYEKYIDDAMDLFALRYIKKPIDQMRLYSGLSKAISLINEEEVSIYVKDIDAIKKIKAKEIMYVEIKSPGTKIVTENHTYYSDKDINYWEKTLNNGCFAKPHKSFILNMEYVDKYRRNEVVLGNGVIIPVASRKQSEFRKIFWSYLRRRK